MKRLVLGILGNNGRFVHSCCIVLYDGTNRSSFLVVLVLDPFSIIGVAPSIWFNRDQVTMFLAGLGALIFCLIN